MPPTKVKPSNCSKEALYKAVMAIEKALRFKTVKDQHRCSDMLEYYISNEGDTIKLSKAGNPIFKNWPPASFGHTKFSWEAAGIAKGHLSTQTNYDPTTDTDEPILQTIMMSGVVIDPGFRNLQHTQELVS